MYIRHISRWMVAVLVICSTLALTTVHATGEATWEAFDKADSELRALEGELRFCNGAIDAYREGLAAKKPKALREAQKAVEEAEKAVKAAEAEPAVAAAREKLQAARAARDGKVESLAMEAPSFRAAKERQAELEKKIENMTDRATKLSVDELKELARMKAEKHGLDRHLYGSVRAWWLRGEVVTAYKAADVAYKECGAVTGKSEALKEANGKLKTARRARDKAMSELPLEGKTGEALSARKTELEGKIAAAKKTLSELEKALAGGKDVSITVKGYDRKAKKEVDQKVSLWIPTHHENIRGVIIAHPMIKGLATSRQTRLAGAREGLAMMVFGDIPGDPKQAVEKFDTMFEKFAEASGHPELKGAPMMLGGLSASVLATRNVACVAPERVFGIVHAAGGNMQEMPEGGAGMVEVPFLAHNGEFEWCGPVGGGHSSGKFGVRKEYGNQTQWVMIREQMLRLWRGKHKHRMSLIVVPNKDHGAWDVDLTALFIRKCAQHRLPKEKRDGSKPATCTPLPAKSGWLTDADLDHPKFEPASYNDYKGDKDNTFWHLDEEMARAVYDYHKGRFILPDPTKASPVPDDWPPGRKK